MPGEREETFDLRTRPEDYPGPPAPGSGLLVDGTFFPLPPRELRAPRGDRALVLAVGANASPQVLGGRLRCGDVDATVPFIAGRLHGYAVGHSAHVSVPGYVAAAPYLAAGHTTPVIGLWLDEAQRECLDHSEANYRRRRLTGGAAALELASGERPDTFDLYDSRWGVLAPPGGDPLPFGDQRTLHAALRRQWAPYAGLVGGDADVAGTLRRLAASAELRAAVRAAFADTGWARPSGLDGHRPVRTRR